MHFEPFDIKGVLDARRPGPAQIGIYFVCFAIILMDGFDTQAIGFVAKYIAEEHQLPIADFGAVFSAGLFGAMIGAFGLGPVADRFGRRRPIAAAILVFAAATLTVPLAKNVPELLVLRFLAGLGLGGAIPSVMALASEYAPSKLRGTLAGLLYAGFPLGGGLGALVTAKLVPETGWRSIFLIGGSVPLLLAVVVLAWVPESLRFLSLQPAGREHISRIVNKLWPGTGNVVLAVPPPTELDAATWRRLIDKGRLRSTVLLWIAFFMCFWMLIVLVLWTPSLLYIAGRGPEDAAAVAGIINLGSVFGTAIGGRLAGLRGNRIIVPVLFALGGGVVCGIGIGGLSFSTVCGLAGGAGFLLGAASAALLALAVDLYPAEIRATGVGWSMALGRMGQIIGPLVVTGLLRAGAGIPLVFTLTAIPAVIAALSIGLMVFPARSRDRLAYSKPEHRHEEENA
ncbi:MAG: hypothetical protein DI537_27725 [Stutzerimonas stutzeri]|nr:MAG: hypothetical protein DI537_27725 [Stutzerimonas stutzeri]